MDYSIDGEEDSHSPRTQQKPLPDSKVSTPTTQLERDTAEEPPSYHPEPEENRPEAEKAEEQEAQGCTRFLSLSFYEQFFQVSQEEVVERIKLNFIPIKREFIEKIRPNPDLYGPFWILTTLIFLLGSTSNLARYFFNWEKTEYIFKLQLVRYGVVLVYSIGFGVPAVLYLVLRLLKCDTLKLPELICIYGYSFGCFIAIFLLCIIPAGWLHWLLMIYGMVNSIAFLVLNLMEYLETLEKKSYIVYGIIGAAQIFLFLMFKMVFFSLIYESAENLD